MGHNVTTFLMLTLRAQVISIFDHWKVLGWCLVFLFWKFLSFGFFYIKRVPFFDQYSIYVLDQNLNVWTFFLSEIHYVNFFEQNLNVPISFFLKHHNSKLLNDCWIFFSTDFLSICWPIEILLRTLLCVLIHCRLFYSFVIPLYIACHHPV